MRPGRTRTQLRVALRRNEVRMHLALQLDVFDKTPVWRQPGEHESGLLNRLAIGVVDLVSVTVALLGVCSAVYLFDDRALGEFRGIEPEAHRATHVFLARNDLPLVGHRRDDRMWSRIVELRRVRPGQPGKVAR